MSFTLFLEAWKRAGDYRGRSTRREYWSFTGYYILQVIALLLLAAGLAGMGYEDLSFGIMSFCFIYFFALLVVGLPLGIRRLHDLGHSWVFGLLAFIPLVGGIILLVFACMDSQIGFNKWGPNPKGIGNENGHFQNGNFNSQMNQSMGQFNPNMNQMNQNMGQFNPNMNQMNQNIGQFNPNMNQINQNMGQFNPNMNQINQNMGQFNPNTNQMNQNMGQFNPNMNQMNQNMGQFNPNTNQMNQNMGQFNPNMNQMNQNMGQFNPNMNQMNQNMGHFNPNTNQMNQNADQFNLKNDGNDLSELEGGYDSSDDD